MNIGAYELLYKPDQKPALGEPFLGFNTADINQSELRELLAFERFCQQSVWAQHDVSGLLSPRFTNKTGISPQQVTSFILENPGHQVYLFHPYPLELTLQNQFLDLAELEHPGIHDALQKVWQHIFNRDLPPIDLPQKREFCCHCNYILATPHFWAKYSLFVQRFMQFLRSENGKNLSQLTPYTLTKSGDFELPMAVFAFERALSHFIIQSVPDEQVINYAFHNPGWNPPQLFEGEADLVNRLQRACRPPFCHEGASIYTQKQIATHTYYHYRKLWSHT